MQDQIAVAVVNSEMAAILLEDCRTGHSALTFPLNLQSIKEPTCNKAKHLAMAGIHCFGSKIYIWDVYTMSQKRAFEDLNRTIKDPHNDARRFGGALILI